MGTLRGFAPPCGPPPATSSPLASPYGDFGTCTFPTTPARYARALALGLAKPWHLTGAWFALAHKPAGSPRDKLVWSAVHPAGKLLVLLAGSIRCCAWLSCC